MQACGEGPAASAGKGTVHTGDEVQRPSATRRGFLRTALGTSGLLLLAACAPSAPPASPPQPAGAAASGTAAPAAAAAGATPRPASTEPVKGGRIRVGMGDEPDGIDPHVFHSSPGGRIKNHILEGLFTWDKDTNVVPSLAEGSKVSADGKTYTITLRQGVAFHSGEELTAEDVKWNLERFMKLSARRSDLSMVAEVRAPEKYTVEVLLKNPTPVFIEALGQYYPLMISRQDSERQLAADLNAKSVALPAGTGPYRLAEWKKGQSIRLTRFDGYKGRPEPNSGYAGQKIAYADEIEFLFMKDNNSRLLSLEKGDIDYAESIPFADVERLKKVPGVVVQSVPASLWTGLYFNFKLPPFNKLEMRLAVAHAIDYKGLVQSAFFGNGTPNNSLIPPVQPRWRTKVHEELYQTSPQKVKELLQQAGYKGEPILFETATAPNYNEVNEVLLAQLTAAGLNVKMRTMDLPAQLDSAYARTRFKKDPEWQMMMLAGSGFRPDPSFNYDARVSSAEHPGYYSNPEMDDVLAKARTTLDTGERVKLYERAQQIMLQDAPIIVLHNINYIDAYRDRLQNVRVADPFQDMLYNTWIKT